MHDLTNLRVTHVLEVRVHHGDHVATASADLNLFDFRPTHGEIVEMIAEAILRLKGDPTNGVAGYLPSTDVRVGMVAEALTHDETAEHGWARYSITEV